MCVVFFFLFLLKVKPSNFPDDSSVFTGRYFDEISQDTGKYCFGVEDTLKALEMGAVEILIVYENLDTMRYVLRVHGAESNGAENGKRTTTVLSAVAETKSSK